MPYSSLRSVFSFLLWWNDFFSTRFITQQKGHTSLPGQCLLLKPRAPCIMAVCEHAAKFKSWVWKRAASGSPFFMALCSLLFVFSREKEAELGNHWMFWVSTDLSRPHSDFYLFKRLSLAMISPEVIKLNTRWDNLQTLLTHDADKLCFCISLCGWRWGSLLSDAEPHFSHLWNGCYENSFSSDLIGQLCKDQMR